MIPPAGRKALVRRLRSCFPRHYHDRMISLAGNSGRPLDLAIELKQFLSGEAVGALGLHAPDLALRADYLNADVQGYFDDVGHDPFLAVSRVETYLYMGNTLLRDSDTMSMAHGVELRVPFVGRPVLEEIGRIPGHLHLGQGKHVKQLLRKSLADILPDHISRLPKTGFHLPVGEWMRGELRESCEAAVSGLEYLPFLHRQSARDRWRSFVEGDIRTSWIKPMLLIALGNYVWKTRQAT